MILTNETKADGNQTFKDMKRRSAIDDVSYFYSSKFTLKVDTRSFEVSGKNLFVSYVRTLIKLIKGCFANGDK